MEVYDFSGYATRNDLECSDGRIIRRDAFKECDGITVPLVWQHQHNSEANVLGHALLENRPDGVYCYGSFNNTEHGKRAKELVRHGDIKALSIYANQLKHNVRDVVHGKIREVSLVLSGANPGAYIEYPILHSEDGTAEEAIIYPDEEIELYHEEETHTEKEASTEMKDDELTHQESTKEETKMAEEKTIGQVFDSLTEEQKKVVYFMIGKAVEDAKNEGGNTEDMKHSVFENDTPENSLSHDDMNVIFQDAKRLGSLKDSVLAHSQEYGIENIEYLFPDDRKIENAPYFIKREDAWVSSVMKGVHHTPFSRIKSVFADITAEDARARGYIKGNRKTEEVFSLLKRSTSPQTIYKKQKLDRDDVIDITDFDVVAWLKTEMRMMLDEEIARAILIGDGRSAASDDKINPLNIRPIWTDDDLFTIKTDLVVTDVDDPDEVAKAFIRAAVKTRKDYKGSGNPILFTTEDFLTDMLLMEDGIGHLLYDSETKLATAMRVSKIVTVPVMEDLTRTAGAKTKKLAGIIVNLNDYNVGADKGGAINMFDDFDIDYNQQKYLIETRCSGALVKPFSAIALELDITD